MNNIPDIRIGNGYDVHSFIDENPDGYILLCGVKIPSKRRLNGHSDSDVALHALTDALLGTRNLGDIGTYFPPTDNQWKNADSSIFVKKAIDLINEHNGRINNIDITIIAEAPKILPYKEEMYKAIAKITGLEHNRINIKATTNEKMGFIGRGEGIASIVTACVAYY